MRKPELQPAQTSAWIRFFVSYPQAAAVRSVELTRALLSATVESNLTGWFTYNDPANKIKFTSTTFNSDSLSGRCVTFGGTANLSTGGADKLHSYSLRQQWIRRNVARYFRNSDYRRGQ